MPIFEYQCRDCGAKFEKILPSAGAAAVRCGSCDSARVEKKLSTFAVAGTALKAFPSEEGPCGACGAPRRGMCGE
jgi:putative FmdB family regulatory protein